MDASFALEKKIGDLDDAAAAAAAAAQTRLKSCTLEISFSLTALRPPTFFLPFLAITLIALVDALPIYRCWRQLFF